MKKILNEKKQLNVLGQDLEQCSLDPLTGWYRDGCCNTDKNDHGVHTVCAKVTDEFLEWCKEAGNDLITPHPEFGFPGLKDGDNWCVCAGWVARAIEAGNDLITPHPEFGFPGLKDGDNWCVCAGWVARAIEAGKGCSVYLKKTHENTLKVVPFEKLKKLAIDLS